ncbi:hypothetical protein SAMD00019534_074230, partial [Acytostelium subglobosum LB1]|uniref:hypothetical protein n=1 Tax=Acytostelium subglobosum LB1 TaxID=1410327 RepID=UPI000644EDC3
YDIKTMLLRLFRSSTSSTFLNNQYQYNQLNNKIRQMTSFREVVNVLNEITPLELAGSWDNVGVLIEPSTASTLTVNSIFLTNDLTENVLDEAIESKCSMIVSYHPPLFSNFKRITQKVTAQRIAVKAIENRLPIYSPHSALDAISGGINDWTAAALIKLIETWSVFNGVKYSSKEIGAGRLLNYGAQGVDIQDVIKCVKQLFGLQYVRLGRPQNGVDRPIKTIAMCAGSGASVILNTPADLYLTGELSHHEILEACAKGNYVIVCDHSNTERGYLAVYKKLIQSRLANVQVIISSRDADPLVIV